MKTRHLTLAQAIATTIAGLRGLEEALREHTALRPRLELDGDFGARLYIKGVS